MHLRCRISLDGSWNFLPDPASSFNPSSLQDQSGMLVNVPAPWQSQAPELRLYAGAAWYYRTFDVPSEWLEGRSIILGLDASDYFTEVWLNNCKIGEHEGGYLPFEFEVTSAVQEGANTLVVRVDDSPRVFPEVPHGKQGWYGPLSGLWQPVWLESRSPRHIRSLSVYPDLKAGMLTANVELSGSPNGPTLVHGRVYDPSGALAASEQIPAPFRGTQASLTISVPDPLAWSLETPHLYRLEVSLENGHVIDSTSKTFGFRTIEARDGRLYLNGEPVFLRGALDQDYYPDTIYTSPGDDFLEDQIRKAKELGLNCLRCHIKVADPRYYDAADRLGMLIWTELPNWTTLTESSGRRGRETLRGILERDGHHPSIIIWTIINEDWGTNLVYEPAHRAWLRDTYHWLKVLDPSRLVVDNSPCEPNFHVQTDLEDYHYYRAIPDHRREWDEFVTAFASRSSFTFCPNGDSRRTGQEPLIVSEFGNWGLPDIELLKDKHGRDPWWFGTGFEWSEGVVYPEGVRHRFHNLGLERVFGSWQKFVEATQWHQYLALKYQIEAMRRRPEISGYIITELTDVHWECNGLLDMKRNPRAFHHVFGEVNAGTVIIPEWERVVYWAGEEVCVGLSISHGEGPALQDATLYWRVAHPNEPHMDEGYVHVPEISAGQTLQIGMAHFTAPPMDSPSIWSVQMELVSNSGEALARNHLDIAVHPSLHLNGSTPRLFSPDPILATRLKKLGYPLAQGLDEAEVVVTAAVDEQLLVYLQHGGRLLVLADRMGSPGMVIPGIHLAAREGTPWDGDWATSFSWIERVGPYKEIPGGPLIDHSFDRIIPDYVLTGWRDWEFPAMVKAGLFVGWIHKPAALIGERWYGKGKAVINSFRLDDSALEYDPTAARLLAALIQQAAAE